MKKRLMMALAAAALVAAMLPGVASAAPDQTICRFELPGGASDFAVIVPDYPVASVLDVDNGHVTVSCGGTP